MCGAVSGAGDRPAAGAWTEVCALEDIYPNSGAAALVGDVEVAVFRVGDAVYAIGNHDPASDANVLGRGIVGDIDGEVVVASPIYKHHYSLISGRCLEEEAYSVPAYLTRVIDGRVWVRGNTPARVKAAGRRRLVVIGDGVAAMRTVDELIKIDSKAYDITIFGAEPRGGYNRVLLSPLLAGDKRLEDIVTHPPEWAIERGISLHCADPVVHIDRARRSVVSREGVEAPYDRLLIATGSRPTPLSVAGHELPGVIPFRDLSDVDAMLALAKTHRRSVVIGGGLLGLEAANGLKARGMEVTVAHIHAHLMERQLDAHAAGLLRAELERRGLKFKFGARTAQVLGDSRVTGVRFEDGSEEAADVVVVAIGVRPNVELAKRAGLPCERGVLVDDTLQTNDPAIYAVGECVQHRGKTFGLVAPLFEQARICATYLAERAVPGYRERTSSAQLKVSGIEVFSAGNHAAGPGLESLTLKDPKRGVYKRLVIEENKVRGAVLYGDTRDAIWYLDLIEKGRDIGMIRDELLFGEPAAPAAAAAAAASAAAAAPAAAAS
jgi:nitrite reductase (NADH) large subunit